MAWHQLQPDGVFSSLATVLDAQSGVVFSPDGTRVYGSGASEGRVWNTQTGASVTIPLVAFTAGAVFSRNNRRLLTFPPAAHQGWGNSVYVWDAETGEQLGQISHDAGFANADISADGERIVTFDGESIGRLA
jgi:WD40 repeat protein